MSDPRNACVYIMLRADGLRKVGWAANVRARRSALNSGYGIRHEIERVWNMGSAAAHWVETQVHRHLRDEAVSREVYALSAGDIAATVEAWMAQCAVTLPGGLNSEKPRREPLKHIDLNALIAEANAWAEAYPDDAERLIRAVRRELGGSSARRANGPKLIQEGPGAGAGMEAQAGGIRR